MTSYKLSSNENPYPPLPGVIEAAHRAVDVMNRYPDMGNTALYDALAARLDVPVGDLAAATGSVALIYQLLAAFCEPGDEVVHAWRSFEAYPDRDRRRGRHLGPGAGDGRRPPRPRRHARGDHAAHPLRHGVHAQQPHRPGRDPVPARRVPGRGARGAARRRGRGLHRVRPHGRPGRRHRDLPAAPERRGLPHLLQGLRPGRVPGRVRRRAGAARRPRSAPCRCRSGSPRSPRRRRSPRSRPSRRCWSGSTRWSASGTGWWPGCATAGWPVPEAQGNFVWFELGERTAEFAAAADELGIVVRPFAGEGARVSIGEDEANDRLLQLAADLPRY